MQHVAALQNLRNRAWRHICRLNFEHSLEGIVVEDVTRCACEDDRGRVTEMLPPVPAIAPPPA